MKKPIILSTLLLVLALILVGCGSTEPKEEESNAYMNISVSDARDLMTSMPDLVVIDVSPVYADGHLPNAVSYPLGDGSLDAAIPTLDKEATYLVYCHSDAASIEGAQKLIDAGFDVVYRLEGNYAAWVDAGYAVEGVYMDVSVDGAVDLMATMPELVVIDVSPAYDDGHLPNAISYPIGDGSLDAAIPTLDKEASYLVYCHNDAASIAGAQKLVDAGFSVVYRLEGNYSAWVESGNIISGVFMDITVNDAKDLIESKPDLVIIDVSPVYDDGHLPNAISHPIGDGSLDAAIPTLDMDKEYLVYCHNDAAAIAGAQKLVDAGFNVVYRMLGNYSAWVDAGFDIEQ
jgi:rhodanese-related sulfurtransferase